MNRRNYQRELEKILAEIEKSGQVPRLFLHSCCAPCSSYVLEYLSGYFQITDFFYNPNISPKEEYVKRAEELKHLIDEMPFVHKPVFLEGDYCPEEFFKMAKGLEKVPEGGERCFRCYRMRMEEAARLAAEGGYDYFTTTLSISPLKNAEKLNQIGAELADTFGVRYLFSDFKKKEGYKKSTEISKEYHMYRQYYCGCVYSKRDRDREIVLRRQQEEQIL